MEALVWLLALVHMRLLQHVLCSLSALGQRALYTQSCLRNCYYLPCFTGLGHSIDKSIALTNCTLNNCK